jgi:benzoyl-CoA reductase subunit D
VTVAAGIDVGTSSVKAAVWRSGPGGGDLLAHAASKIRRREIAQVVEEAFDRACAEAGVDAISYVATTGEGEEVPFATGHFFGMTTHARGALALEPRARAVLDIGALHARAIAMDGQGRVRNSKMTSQCASGSGQFLENIARYLGVSLGEIGALSSSAARAESVSSICAVLAETDVINMVSRGIPTAEILRGIHESMAGRFARLLQTIGADGVVFLSGGLAGDEGLAGALDRALSAGTSASRPAPEIVSHPLSMFAGAIGAAIWGAFRYEKLGMEGTAWTAKRAS